MATGHAKQRRLAIATLVLAVLFGGQGCATQQDAPAVSTLSVEEAKSEAQSMEDHIAALFPAQSVAHVDQLRTGRLLSCERKSAYQWYGRTRVDLRKGVDVDAILGGIVEKWDGDNSFIVSRRTDFEKARIVELDGHFGSTFYVNVAKDNGSVTIASYSPCFTLPEGADPGGEY